jgi:hypothetical protein
MWRTFENVNRWITHAEGKAAAALAAAGVGLGVLYDLVRDRAHPTIPAAVLGGACALLFLAGGFVAAAALWARPRGKTPTAPNPLHFESVARGYPDAESEYVEALAALCRDPAALKTAIARQVWANSQTAKRKFLLANVGLACLVAGLALLGAAAFALLH